jgi:hypothetical protein
LQASWSGTIIVFEFEGRNRLFSNGGEMCPMVFSSRGFCSWLRLWDRSPFQEFIYWKAQHTSEIGKRDRMNRRAIDCFLYLVPKVLFATSKQPSGFLNRDKLFRFDLLYCSPRFFCVLIQSGLLRDAQWDNVGEQTFPELVADPR